MPVRMVVTFQLKPGATAKAYADLFAPVARETNKEPGCEQYELFASTSDPGKVVLIERWADAKALEVHMGVLKQRDMSALVAMRAGPPVAERFEF